jgi:hypothetical protein
MIWLALGFALTAWAGVAAYGIWAWRDDRRAERNEARAMQERTEKSFDRIQVLIKQWSAARETTPSPSDFPARGDNFETITPENVIEFGKRPRSQDETPTQPCA